MRGCLFVLALAALVLGVVVVVGLPAAAGGAVTAALTTAGFEAADTTVTVSSDPPTELATLHADVVRVRATRATFRGYRMASLDVTLRDVALVDRRAGSVEGELTDVLLPDVGGAAVTLPSIALSGTSDATVATTTLGEAESRALVADAAAAALGVRASSIELAAPDRVSAALGPVAAEGHLAVDEAGDLVVRRASGPATGDPILLLRGGRDLPIHLTSVTVTPSGGLRLVGRLTFGLLG